MGEGVEWLVVEWWVRGGVVVLWCSVEYIELCHVLPLGIVHN